MYDRPSIRYLGLGKRGDTLADAYWVRRMEGLSHRDARRGALRSCRMAWWVGPLIQVLFQVLKWWWEKRNAT